jgi:DNA-binding cell septation regulator SpoVG
MIKIEIGQYKEVNKGSLKAFFSLVFTDTGLQVYDCKHMVTDGRDWIAFPSKEITKKDGTKDFFPVMKFLNKDYLAELSNAIVAQIKKQVPNDNATSNNVQDEPSLLW